MSQELNLFEQTKNLEFIGERLSGEPEILHEIQEWAGLPTSRSQIQRVLEYVPRVFPEDWKSPEDFHQLTPKQQRAYLDIARVGPFRLTGPDIELVIKLGAGFRDHYHRPKDQKGLSKEG